MSEPLIEARDVVKSYIIGRGKVPVLRGVTVSAARGDFLALRGASGAGKSTLLHLLGGLDSPDEGNILFDGVNYSTLNQTELARLRNKKVGFVFQAYHLLPELDALENVCLPGRMARAQVPNLRERGRELLDRVGLKERMDHRPYELSGGEQQRVSIARALINQPALLLADEPTGNLDSHTGESIIELLRLVTNELSTTFIIATHDPKVANRAPRLIDLVDGRIQ